MVNLRAEQPRALACLGGRGIRAFCLIQETECKRVSNGEATTSSCPSVTLFEARTAYEVCWLNRPDSLIDSTYSVFAASGS